MHVHTSRITAALAILLLASSLTLPATAENPPPAVAEIRDTSSRYLEALNSGDAKRIADFWTPQGTFVDAANVTHQARELARQEFSEASPAEKRSFTAQESSIRLVTPRVAIERGTTTEQGARGGANYLALWVLEGTQWRLDHLREFAVTAQPDAGRLAELAGMVGEWEARSEGMVARLMVRWSYQQQFLLQKFTLERPGRAPLRGEQRITWDASQQHVRSWIFRSDGGFGEGVWSLEGDTWVVHKTGVAPTGEKVSTINLWVNESPNSLWFKSLKTQMGDQSAADLVLQFQRVEAP